VPRVPRIGAVALLAIRFDTMLRAGEVADVATLAMLSRRHCSRG
jgi:hypothetical protein